MRVKVIGTYILLTALSLTGCANYSIKSDVKRIPQDNTRFVTAQSSQQLNTNEQAQSSQVYLDRLYAPWLNRNKLDSNWKIHKTESWLLRKYTKKPGWGANYQTHDPNWITQIIDNIKLKPFPNMNVNGITLRTTPMRELPTLTPSYNNPRLAGEGYPFDNLQVSLLRANLPLRILQVTRDGKWYLVITQSVYGWVQAENIDFVDQQFIANWRTDKYVAATKDSGTLHTGDMKHTEKSRIGTIYPLVKTHNTSYEVNVAVPGSKRYALLKRAYLPKQVATLFPMPLTEKNVAVVANDILGKPYGWGGLNDDRDCSSTLQDLYATFGIWLPRNSSEQARAGKKIVSLRGMSKQQKRDIIKAEAVPFATLIHLPGHIMLYLGEKNNQLYVYHTFWGLATKLPLIPEGRAVAGMTAITKLNLGHGYLNVPNTLLDKADSFTVLAPRVL